MQDFSSRCLCLIQAIHWFVNKRRKKLLTIEWLKTFDITSILRQSCLSGTMLLNLSFSSYWHFRTKRNFGEITEERKSLQTRNYSNNLRRKVSNSEFDIGHNHRIDVERESTESRTNECWMIRQPPPCAFSWFTSTTHWVELSTL